MTIAVIGVGLIGGSFALCCKHNNIAQHIIGVDNNPEHLTIAKQLHLIDEVLPLDKAVKKSDLIVLAIPVNVIVEILPALLNQIKPFQTVIDMGSTKANICECIRQHKHRTHFVACHPMWGTEYSGPRAATHNAFAGKVCILCDTHNSHPNKVQQIQHIFETLHMHILFMSAEEHDIHTAYISHISHITSFALANTVLEKEKQEERIFQLASAGFESTVRLAKSDKAMWTPIFLQNKKNILEVLNEHIAQLQKIKQSIETDNKQSIDKFIEQANKIRKILK